MLTRERHRVALERAGANWTRPGPKSWGLEIGDPVLVAHHVRQAALALDERIGVADVEEVLGRMFSRFCVGK